ncbi:unknown [Clostridium sp. CAG:571]|nr:unknown [Clostridium sp. CAG:571]
MPDSIENIALYNEKIESNNLIYLEKQDILTKKNIERQYHFHYREVNFFKSEIQIIIDEIKMAVEKKKKIVLLRRK